MYNAYFAYLNSSFAYIFGLYYSSKTTGIHRNILENKAGRFVILCLDMSDLFVQLGNTIQLTTLVDTIYVIHVRRTNCIVHPVISK